jgi:hypothetical protein
VRDDRSNNHWVLVWIRPATRALFPLRRRYQGYPALRRRCSLPALPDEIFAHSPFPRTQTSLQLAELQPTSTFLSSLFTSSLSTTPSHTRFVRRGDCIALSQQPFVCPDSCPSAANQRACPAACIGPCRGHLRVLTATTGQPHLLTTPAAASPTQHRRISRLGSASRPVTLIAAVAVVWATKRLPQFTDARFRRQDNNSSARSLNHHCTTQT